MAIIEVQVPDIGDFDEVGVIELLVKAGDTVKVTQGNGSAVLVATVDAKLPANAVRVAAAHRSTAALGSMFGAITVEKAGEVK